MRWIFMELGSLSYNATSFIFFMMVNGPSLGSPISQKI